NRGKQQALGEKLSEQLRVPRFSHTFPILQRLYGARAFSSLTPRQSTNFQIAKPDFVTVILQQEARFSLGAEPRNIFVFALGDSIEQRRASQIVFDDFGSVKPMFDVFALNDDS